MAKLTSPKIREAESMTGWFTLIGWFGCVVLFIMVMVEQWWYAGGAFIVAAAAIIIAIRSGHEVNDCQAIAQALKEKQNEDVKALYGKEQINE
jgi:hypothetical protein